MTTIKMVPYLQKTIESACRVSMTNLSDENLARCRRIYQHVVADKKPNHAYDHIALWGFGDAKARNAFLRLLRKAWKARIVHSSFTNTEYFEALVVAPVIFNDETDFLSCFNMSIDGISVLANESVMPMSRLEWKCIERINQGSKFYGNWYSQIARTIRSKYEMTKREQEYIDIQNRILRTTGLTHTPENMLRLWDHLQRTRSVHETVLVSVQGTAAQIHNQLCLLTAEPNQDLSTLNHLKTLCILMTNLVESTRLEGRVA